MEPSRSLAALVTLLVMVTGALAAKEKCPLVTVEQGVLRGQLITRETDNSTITMCLYRAPYARPPVGKLRFKDSKKPLAWKGIRASSEPPPVCIQRPDQWKDDIVGTEDCLYVSIFVQLSQVQRARCKKSPVIVFLHNGLFIGGNGNMDTIRPDPYVLKSALFVGVNYRVGPMGFLNTEDSQAPGNAGLKDQREALRWVQRNIHAFGGDRGSVALMGDEAGGVAAFLHLLAPSNRGLFQRVLSTSGALPDAWGWVEKPRRYALALRGLFNATCRDLQARDAVRCLQRVPAQDILRMQFDIPTMRGEEGRFFVFRSRFLPSRERAGRKDGLLTKEPRQLVKRGSFLRVPLLTGSSDGAGISVALYGNLLNASRLKELDKNFEKIIGWMMPWGLENNKHAVRKLRSYYLGNRSIAEALDDQQTLQNLTNMLTDVSFSAGAAFQANLMSKRTKFFLYNFTLDGLAFVKKENDLTDLEGVMLRDDMDYVWDPANDDGTPKEIDSDDQTLRVRSHGFIYDYLSTGNPTPKGSKLPKWIPTDPKRQPHYQLDETITMKGPSAPIIFWEGLQDKYGSLDA